MAIDPISLSMVQAAATPPTPIRIEASELATAQFKAMMQTAPPAPAPGAVRAEADVSVSPVEDGPASMGSRILSGLQQNSVRLSERWESIAQRLDSLGSTPSVTDMLRVQTELLQVSIQSELVSKAVSKSTQNLDGLVKLQ